ncbi:stAR-related lipid transfer protein 7, mitochondrial isoform X2 [Anabrus simplex]|uniref:stAR-related lipid transfer protein 7, mitochondrial isoform X2 n=1 Tax=Anabrus simplex TaxID=316456 RepID=UPI0035A28C00
MVHHSALRLEMYSGNVTRVLVFTQRNCLVPSRSKHFMDDGTYQRRHQNRLLVFCSLFVRNISPARKFDCLSRGLRSVCVQYSVLRFLKNEVLKIPLFLKRHSVHIVRTCTQQCECVVAHRIRRGQQIFSLYTRLWDERALKELVGRVRQQLSRRGKLVFWGAMGITAYSGEKISDEEMQSCMEELEFIYNLRDSTMTCNDCHKRQVVDIQIPNIIYCQCPGSKPVADKSQDDSQWIPFIERQDLIVWRKMEDQGHYSYKVYGKYDDVTATDFFQVQIDTDYRKEWDTTVVQLEVLESDPQNNSDVIYWEMQWPRMFSNRDYVFNRRYMVDHEKKLMVLANRGTEHPKRPVSKENYRVTHYYSYMVIKPINSFEEPGIEFSLTYYDNPGVSIPAGLSSWVAKNGLPDFLGRVRIAARQLACRRRKEECGDLASLMPVFNIPDELSEPKTNLFEGEPAADGDEGTKIESIPERIKTAPETLQEPASGDKPSSESPPDGDQAPSPPESGAKSELEVPANNETEPSGRETSGGDASGEDHSSELGQDECSQAEPKPRDGYSNSSFYFTSFPYQDPPDVNCLQFHTANLFT